MCLYSFATILSFRCERSCTHKKRPPPCWDEALLIRITSHITQRADMVNNPLYSADRYRGSFPVKTTEIQGSFDVRVCADNGLYSFAFTAPRGYFACITRNISATVALCRAGAYKTCPHQRFTLHYNIEPRSRGGSKKNVTENKYVQVPHAEPMQWCTHGHASTTTHRPRAQGLKKFPRVTCTPTDVPHRAHAYEYIRLRYRA